MSDKKLGKQDWIILDDGRQAERAIAVIFIVNGLVLLAGVFALVVSGGV